VRLLQALQGLSDPDPADRRTLNSVVLDDAVATQCSSVLVPWVIRRLGRL
jgi:hypothetical protein